MDSFNPRICKRCDIILIYPCSRKISFNPRICKRCDVIGRILSLCPICFNPRICKRCDMKGSNKEQMMGVSIHASVKDATTFPDKPQPVGLVSIHASVKDATYRSVHRLKRQKCFNPRICKRCDPLSSSNGVKRASFNPRICKRCDCRIKDGYIHFVFQSTHL